MHPCPCSNALGLCATTGMGGGVSVSPHEEVLRHVHPGMCLVAQSPHRRQTTSTHRHAEFLKLLKHVLRCTCVVAQCRHRGK